MDEMFFTKITIHYLEQGKIIIIKINSYNIPYVNKTEKLTKFQLYTKSSCSKLTVKADNTLNLAALKRSEVLSFFTRLQRLVSARSVYLEDSIFQRTAPLYATESFLKRVLKRGTSNESCALIE